MGNSQARSRLSQVRSRMKKEIDDFEKYSMRIARYMRQLKVN